MMRTQKPDTTPGNYYVTMRRGKQVAWLAGPFPNDHAKALSLVDKAREVACMRDPFACFYEFGTARASLAYTVPGKLNVEMG